MLCGGRSEVVPVTKHLYAAVVGVVALGLVVLGASSWVALVAGIALAISFDRPAPAALKTWTSRLLQWGVIGLGAGMNLAVVLRVGASGAWMTAVSLAVTLVVGMLLAKALRVPRDTALLLSVGTAICGGSAIAAVASVTRPKPQEISISLAVVFLLNAAALVVFPMLGHRFGLSEVEFGRWAALAVHDTSSVVGAALQYGPTALSVATTTKLARALWIVPITLGIATLQRREGSAGVGGVKWPWFIAGFLAMAALFTWVPALAPAKALLGAASRRLLVLALFLIGLSLSRDALRSVGWRPFAQGALLWFFVGVTSLLLARGGLG